MISKASDILVLFIEEESKKLESIDMPHMPTLGTAYEEITKQGINLNSSIPTFLDLKVVTGFISVDTQMLPEQIDCMLVTGSGQKYGLTDIYIYPVEQVLCIFEVKKTLNKSDLCDAFQHLGSFRKKVGAYYAKKLDSDSFNPNLRSAQRMYAKITGRIPPDPYSEIFDLPIKDQILYYTLVQETLTPISIIQGYAGYKSEAGLRKAFIEFIQKKIDRNDHDCGVGCFPSLVTCNNFCLLKSNGLPFITIKDKNSWVTLGSTRHNPAKLMLEIIWSKISNTFNVQMPWDDGLHMDNVDPLLVAEVIESQDNVGWYYKTIEPNTEARLKRDDDALWEPSPIGPPEISLIYQIAGDGGVDITDESLIKFIQEKHSCLFKEVVDNLILTREFMTGDSFLRPINNNIHLLVASDGNQGWISSEEDRFRIWCNKNKITPNFLSFIFVETK